MKLSVKTGITSTLKATTEYEIKDCESVEEWEEVNNTMKDKAMNLIGVMNSRLGGHQK